MHPERLFYARAFALMTPGNRMHPSWETTVLAHLRIECGQPRFRRAQRILGLLEFLRANGAGFHERFETFDVFAPIRDVGFDSGAVGLSASNRRLLFVGVDLQQR